MEIEVTGCARIEEVELALKSLKISLPCFESMVSPPLSDFFVRSLARYLLSLSSLAFEGFLKIFVFSSSLLVQKSSH
ncbi:hypothetical protein CsSME_00003724 [Camellia sinensis var. sinensis]